MFFVSIDRVLTQINEPTLASFEFSGGFLVPTITFPEIQKREGLRNGQEIIFFPKKTLTRGRKEFSFFPSVCYHLFFVEWKFQVGLVTK